MCKEIGNVKAIRLGFLEYLAQSTIIQSYNSLVESATSCNWCNAKYIWLSAILVIAPKICNSLQYDIRSTTSLSLFIRKLISILNHCNSSILLYIFLFILVFVLYYLMTPIGVMVIIYNHHVFLKSL